MENTNETFTSPIQSLPGIGVCVGRFQTPYLHAGHLAILRAVNDHSAGIVFIGTAATPMTKTNPLDFITRKLMVQAVVGNHVTIVPIADHRSDYAWSDNLDAAIRTIAPFGKVTLYHSRDSFKDHYHGIHVKNCHEIPSVGENLNATEIRKEIGTRPIGSGDFRAGVIYGTQNMFPRVQPTVDVAIVDLETEQALVGRKNGNTTLCFIGGFIDMTDKTAQEAGSRELQEETGIVYPANKLEYVSTNKINDWRDTPSTSVMTTFFAANVNLEYRSYKAADDIEELRVVDLTSPDFVSFFSESHKVLAVELQTWLLRKRESKAI